MSVNKDWIYRTNIYEVNLRQYTEEGTIKAFVQHLPRLRAMGVETLWFMPITPISLKERKGTLGSYYACSDYTSVNPEFGTLEDFTNLVRQAHDLGFYVIIDWVANHTGWDHHWTIEHPEWYERDKQGNFVRASGMDDIIELDLSHTDLRAAMIAAMKFWVATCDIDGFRCDLAFWVQLDFWLEAIPRLNRLKPLFWLAESDPLEHPAYMQVFDVAYTWMWMHRTQSFCNGEQSLADLTNILASYQSAPCIKAWFTTNHDENTWNGTEYEKYKRAALPLAVHNCTWPGLPLIYSGQELPNHKRLAFFEKDVIEWTGHNELEGFYRTLLDLHHNHPALDSRARVFLLGTSAPDGVLAYLRRSGDDEVMVWLNLSGNEAHFNLTDGWLGGLYEDVFSKEQVNAGRMRAFELEPWSWRVWTRIYEGEEGA